MAWVVEILPHETRTCLFYMVNSLAPGKFDWTLIYVIFKQIFLSDVWGISCEIAIIQMSLDTDDQSTLVHVMAWCRQAPSHYLSQCWPRSMSPNGVTRPQWVNTMTADGLAMRGANIHLQSMRSCCSHLRAVSQSYSEASTKWMTFCKGQLSRFS